MKTELGMSEVLATGESLKQRHADSNLWGNPHYVCYLGKEVMKTLLFETSKTDLA
jgi:hypothetical protein